ncbi:unnamed protein product [Victoria cruziana]
MVKLKAGSRPPWVGLAAAVWVQIAAGNAFNFPLYSPTLKSVLGYSQQQLTLLGVANDIGENVGILPGIVCNKLPPWAVLMIGALFCFLGYGVLWLAVTQTVSSLPFIALWLASCIATNSGAWFGTAVLVTNMRNFPLSRGTVAGILKGYAGLSAAVYTEIYTGVLYNSSAKLLLFLTLGLPAICLAMMYFIRRCTPASGEDSAEHGHFLFTQAASILLGIYLLTTTILDDVLSVSYVISVSFAIVMVIFLLAPLAIPIKMTLFRSRSRTSSVSDLRSSGTEPLLVKSKREEKQANSTSISCVPVEPISENQEPYLHVSLSARNLGTLEDEEDIVDVDILLAEGEGAIEKKRRPKRGEDFKFREAIIKADFWLLFLVYFLGVGSGVTVLNNLAQIGTALGANDTSSLLSIFSFCNFVGRLGGGALSEYFVRLKAIPRTFWMTASQLIMLVAYLLFASALSGTLYAATALLGICYGFQFSIMIATASELFGLKHFGVIYNFIGIGNPLGALIFSAGLAGYVYDKEAARQFAEGVCGLGSLLSVILTVRIRPVYKMLYSGGSVRNRGTSQS